MGQYFKTLWISLLVPVCALANNTDKLPSVERIILDNGLTVMLREDRSVPLVSVEFRSRAGSILDPKFKEGLAELTATLLTYGTRSRSEDDISNTLGLLGATLAANAGSETFSVYGSVPTIDSTALDTWLALMADIVQNPTFPEEAVTRVKRRRLGQLTGLIDNRSALAQRAMMKAIFGSSPYGRSSAGTLASIASISRADVADFHRTFLVPDDAVLGIAGDFDRESLIESLRTKFGSTEWGEVCDGKTQCVRGCVKNEAFCTSYKSRGAPAVKNPYPNMQPSTLDGATIILMDVNDPTLNQAQLRFGGPLSLTFNSKAWLAYSLGVQMLGGDFNARLNQELRVKKGLTYGARWSVQPDDIAAGASYATTYTNPKNVVLALQTILDEVRKFRSNTAKESELQRVVQRIVNGFVFRFETPGKVLSQYMDLWQERLPEERLRTYRARASAVTLEQVKQAAQILPDDHWVAIVVANRSMEKTLETFAQSVGARFKIVTPKWLGIGN